MPGIRPVFEKGPLSFPATVVANGGNIKGGQLVQPDGTTGRIQPAADNSATCLGVATGDASAFDFANADTTDTWGNTVVNMHVPPNEVAVAYQGVWRLKNSAAGTIAFGALVACAANGEVKALGAGVFGTCIGRCVEPGGISASAKGKILLGGVGA
jgi:hypothetical protein